MFHKRHPPVGSRPGTLAIDPAAAPPVMTVIAYDAGAVTTQDVDTVEAIRPFLERPGVTWIDVQGLGDEATFRALAQLFDIHPLAMEDLVNAPQRPKVEAYAKHVLLITRTAKIAGDDLSIDREQLSILVGRDYVLTVQERRGDVLEPIRRRVQQGKGPIRQAGAGYLAYAILDTVIDAYYPALETMSEFLEHLEAEVVAAPARRTLRSIYRTKRELLAFRRIVWPHRELLNAILRGDDDFFDPDVRLHFRDVYDHCVQIGDVLETYREMAGGLLESYLSSVSNRTNEVMKVLTIMASVFIPLTFIAGVYGMNFENMPELSARLGYPIVLGVMAALAVGMVYYFARRGWIGLKADDSGDD